MFDDALLKADTERKGNNDDLSLLGTLPSLTFSLVWFVTNGGMLLLQWESTGSSSSSTMCEKTGRCDFDRTIVMSTSCSCHEIMSDVRIRLDMSESVRRIELVPRTISQAKVRLEALLLTVETHAGPCIGLVGMIIVVSTRSLPMQTLGVATPTSSADRGHKSFKYRMNFK
jgi:hypothetical protein